MKAKIFFSIVLCLSVYFFVQSMKQKPVKLESSDEQQFQVSINAAKKSITAKNLIEDIGTQYTISLPNVQGEVLEFILDLLGYMLSEDLEIQKKQELISRKINEKIKELTESNPTFGYDFFAAVNYLDIPYLLPFAINSVVALIGNQIEECKKDALEYALKLIPHNLENQIREIIINEKSIVSFLVKFVGLYILSYTDSVNLVAFSPNNKYILTSDGNAPKLLDTNTGELIRTFCGHTAFVSSVVFSPDGKYILTGSFDHTAKLWDINTGNLIRTFHAHAAFVNSVAFSPDGKYALTGSCDNTAKLWDINTGNLIHTFPGRIAVISVVFSPDNKYLATGNLDKTAELWDIDTGNLIYTFTGHTEPITSISFSPNGKYIITGSWDNTAKLWDTNTGNLIRTFSGHIETVTSVAFSPDGKYVLTGSWDKKAKLWDTSTGNLIRTFTGHTKSVTSVAFSPDGRYILTGSGDNTAIIWDISVLVLNLNSIVCIVLLKSLKEKGKEEVIFEDSYWTNIYINLPDLVKAIFKII